MEKDELDLENIVKDPLDKFNVLKLYDTVHLDVETQKLTFSSLSSIHLTPKEFETVLKYYEKYKNEHFEGGSCVGCKVQKLENIRKGYEEFLGKLRTKYFGGVEVG